VADSGAASASQCGQGSVSAPATSAARCARTSAATLMTFTGAPDMLTLPGECPPSGTEPLTASQRSAHTPALAAADRNLSNSPEATGAPSPCASSRRALT